MNRIFQSLRDYGDRCGLSAWDVLDVKRAWFIEITTGEVTSQKNVKLRLPARRKRGNNAVSVPLYGFDGMQYAGSNDTAFWTELKVVVANDAAVLKALTTFLETPLVAPFGSLVGVKKIAIKVNGKLTTVATTEWMVVTYKGKPVTDRPAVAKECERLFHASLEQGEVGMSVLSGKREPIARTHDPLRFRGGKAQLFSVNEAAMQYKGTLQAYNFPIGERDSRLYATGIDTLLAESLAYLTDSCALVLWPDEGLDHPLLGLARKLLCGYYKWEQLEEIEGLWAEVEAIPESESRINVALLRQNSTRISVRAFESISVSMLKRNLLVFRAEFTSHKGVTLRRVAPYTTMEGRPTVSTFVFVAIAWAVVMGTPYPQAGIIPVLLKYPDDNQTSQELLVSWLQALKQRHTSSEPTPCLKGPMKKIFDMTVEEKLEVINSRLSPSTDSQTLEYRLGRLVNAFCHLRESHHSGQVANAKSRPLAYAMNNFRNWLATNKAQVYADSLQQNNRSDIFMVLYNEILGEVKESLPRRIRRQDLFKLGFTQQDLGSESYKSKKRQEYRDHKASKPAA